MPLSGAQIALVQARYVATPQPKVLYHGTTDAAFFAKICLGTGFTSNEAFMGLYSTRSLGATTQYGPGIYLADTKEEALKYGNMVIRFEFEAGTNYWEFYGNTSAICAAIGTSKQNILDEGRLYALIRVTGQYYTLRTPFTMVVSPDYI